MDTVRRFFLVFISSIAWVPIQLGVAQITRPEECLGFKPGADFHLATYEQAIGCYERGASRTPRMKLFDMGATPMGRRMKYAVVSSEANMARLDEHREISKRLSLARGMSEREARDLAQKGKVVVWVDGGLHATECAPAQQMIQLAYDLITGEDPQTRSIRDNVIALLVFPNPDGMTLVSEWYHSNVGTEFETSNMPWVYNKYAGHDNNRDSFYANLSETQNLMRLQFHEWFPEVLLNHHQSGPFPARIFIPPYAEPTNPDVHPLIARLENLIGGAMGLAFDLAGQSGVISRVAYDSYYPGYFSSIPDSHNCPAILTEIALYRYATPHEYKLTDLPESHREMRPGRFYPSPWKGGWWRLGDAAAYALTASKAVLETSARYRSEFLFYKYRMAMDAIEQGLQKQPFGWIVPPDQHDPGTTAAMIDKLILLGAEVYAAEEPFTDRDASYPKGTYLIPASQPFGPFVRQMFQKQDYPDLRKYPHLWQNMVGQPVKGEEPLRPYDAAGWTLPLQFGVKYVEMSRLADVRKTLLREATIAGGQIVGQGSSFIIPSAENNSFIAVNGVLAAGGKVRRVLEDFAADGRSYGRGTFIADTTGIPAARLREIAGRSRIAFVAGNSNAAAETLRPLRVGLYGSWTGSMDEGWTRLILESFDVPFKSLTDADLRAGDLRQNCDAVILPDMSPEQIVRGNPPGSLPAKYTGGITAAGVQNLRAFVESGGVLICNGASTLLAIEQFKLPLTNAVRGLSPDQFYIPGSILRLDYDTSHPLAFGMQERGVCFFARSLVFRLQPAGAGEAVLKVVARYPKEPLLLSGYAQGDVRIQGEAAVVDAPLGNGRVVLFGFNVVNRWQTPAVLKLLFNALLLAGSIAPPQ